HPDIVVARSSEELSPDIRDKIALFADVDLKAGIACPDVRDVYLVPSVLEEQGLDRLVVEKLGISAPSGADEEWRSLVDRIDTLEGEGEIALVRKHVKVHDADLSVPEAPN